MARFNLSINTLDLMGQALPYQLVEILAVNQYGVSGDAARWGSGEPGVVVPTSYSERTDRNGNLVIPLEETPTGRFYRVAIDHTDANTGVNAVYQRVVSLVADSDLHLLANHVLARPRTDDNAVVQMFLRYVQAAAQRYNDGHIVRWLKENLPADIVYEDDAIDFNTVRNEAIEQSQAERDFILTLLFGTRVPAAGAKLLAALIPDESSGHGIEAHSSGTFDWGATASEFVAPTNDVSLPSSDTTWIVLSFKDAQGAHESHWVRNDLLLALPDVAAGDAVTAANAVILPESGGAGDDDIWLGHDSSGNLLLASTAVTGSIEVDLFEVGLLGSSNDNTATIHNLIETAVKAKARTGGPNWDYNTDLDNLPVIPVAFTAAQAVAAINAALPNLQLLNRNVRDGGWRAEDTLWLTAPQGDAFTATTAQAANYVASNQPAGPRAEGRHIAFRVPKSLYALQPRADDLAHLRLSTGDDDAEQISVSTATYLAADDDYWYFDLEFDLPAASVLSMEWDAPTELANVDIDANDVTGLEDAIRALTHGNQGGAVVLPHSTDAPTDTVGVVEGTVRLIEPSVGAPYIIGLTTEEMVVEARGRGTVILDGASKDADWRGNGTISGNTAADGQPFDISWSLGFVDGGDPRYQSLTVAIRTTAVTQDANPIFYVRIRRKGTQTWTDLGQVSFSRQTQTVEGATGTLATLDYSHQPRATKRAIAAILQYHRGFEREYSSTADFRNIWEYKPATARTPTGWVRLTPNSEPWSLIGNMDDIPVAKRPVEYDDILNTPTIPAGVEKISPDNNNVAVTSLNQWADTNTTLPSDYADKLFRIVLGGYRTADILVSGIELDRIVASTVGGNSNTVRTSGVIEFEVHNAGVWPRRTDTIRIGKTSGDDILITCDLVRNFSGLDIYQVN